MLQQMRNHFIQFEKRNRFNHCCYVDLWWVQRRLRLLLSIKPRCFYIEFFACRDTVLNPSEVNDFLLIEMIEKWNYILRIHFHSINILHLVNSLVLFWNRWVWNCSKSSSQPTKNSFFKFTSWRMPVYQGTVYQVVLKCWWRMVQGIK